LNILIINDFSFINGGAGKIALSSAISLANRGMPVTLFSGVEPTMPSLKSSNVKVINTGQWDILRDPNRIRAAKQGIWNSKAKKIMVELLADLNPKDTVIHVHSWTKALSSSILNVCAKFNFKTICTLHDYFIACPNGGFYNYQKNKPCKLKGLSTRCLIENCDVRSYPQKTWRFARQIIQKSIGGVPGRIKFFITISDFSEEILKPYLPSNAKLYRVNNPIDIQKKPPITPEKFVNFVYVGRLSQEKGVHLFANAAKNLGLHSIFVGEGYCKEEIQKICKKAQITGWVSGNKVTEILSQSRALVFPSIWYETQGLVVLEAAALGLPSVIPETSAATEFVEDGHDGLYFKSGDLDHLMQKMTQLKDPEYAKKLGENAYKRYWQSPFTMEKHTNDLVEIYKKVLES